MQIKAFIVRKVHERFPSHYSLWVENPLLAFLLCHDTSNMTKFKRISYVHNNIFSIDYKVISIYRSFTETP